MKPHPKTPFQKQREESNPVKWSGKREVKDKSKKKKTKNFSCNENDYLAGC